MATQEDVWIPSVCALCMNSCNILVRRQDGAVTKIEGNPKSPISRGTICPKGASGIMMLYDPNRLKYPMKRTNPERGIGIDPRWQRITWEEALETITERLKGVRKDNPMKLLTAGTAGPLMPGILIGLWGGAFGTANGFASGAGIHCGNGWHMTSDFIYQSVGRTPDIDNCRYLITFGSNIGMAAGYAFNMIAKRVAEARARGMKLVAVDPVLAGSASKADVWIPIRPGTDAALALAMVNVLLNELETYDAEFLKKYTNGPYLIGPDGTYVRDGNEPVVWDPIEERARPFNDPGIKDFALLGTYAVNGVRCSPSFQLVKDHVKKYTPEMASEITTVPASTIRQIAKEFGENARIGSTIVIDGKEMPYRPVAAHEFKGANGHKHQYLIAFSIDLLNLIVGAQDVPGAILGQSARCLGNPITGWPNWGPSEGPDGLTIPGRTLLPGPHRYPPREPVPPTRFGLQELQPFSAAAQMLPLGAADPEKYGIAYKPEMMVMYGSNLLMSYANPDDMVKFLKAIPFIVAFKLWIDETCDFVDIVLPDATYLERLDPMPNFAAPMHHTSSNLVDDWCYAIRQPIVKPIGEARNAAEIFIELADRAGFLAEFNSLLNLAFSLKDPYKLDPKKRYTWEEVSDRAYRCFFGDDHGVEWFKQNGVYTWPRRVEETYWRPFYKSRVPIYYEFIERTGRQVQGLLEKLGLDELDASDYQALPDWKPCPAYEIPASTGYDLYAFYYRVPFHTFSFTAEIPWLDEVSEWDGYAYAVLMNTETGRRKGIKDGDAIRLVSAEGRSGTGRVKLTEGVHPEALAIANCLGHWSNGMPIAKGKGFFINGLQPLTPKHMDFVAGGLDLCIKVKVEKVR